MALTTPSLTSFAWYGLRLALPETWNLTFHHGAAAEGLLRFADLHTTRLELRWRTAKHPEKHLARLAARLERKGAKRAQDPAGIRIIVDDRTLLLAHTPRRLIELHWLEKNDYSAALAADFAKNLGTAGDSTHWPWSVYGAAGDVHRAARLKKIRLLPGETRLEFHRGRCRATLGSWSMADRLLQSGTLRDWAAAHIPLIHKNPGGHWHSTADAETFTLTRRAGLFRRRMRSVLKLTHDAAQNRIRWDQRSYPPGKEGVC